jgi:hypothetical protein
VEYIIIFNSKQPDFDPWMSAFATKLASVQEHKMSNVFITYCAHTKIGELVLCTSS